MGPQLEDLVRGHLVRALRGPGQRASHRADGGGCDLVPYFSWRL